MQSDNISNIKLDLLIPNPHQPRKQFNELSLKELAISIKAYGVLNPILVRKKDNLYEIIAGERRYRAAKMVGLTEIPAIIKNVDDNKMSEIAMIENIQRENINAIEEAKSYQEILKNNKITEKELSDLLGKSQSFISNKIRLLNLPQTIQNALINKKISEKHARSLLRVNEQSKQLDLLKRIITEKLSVRTLDEIITKEELTNKKEEKESDNMNNDNFFPNFNNGQNQNDMSLNFMNMQSINNQINQNQILPESPNVLNATENTISNTIPTSQINSIDELKQPVNNSFEPTMPNLNQNNNQITTENNNANSFTGELPQSTNQMVDIPLFSETNFNQTNNTGIEPKITEQSTPKIVNENVQENLSPVETPLFNQEINMSQMSNPTLENANLNESFYEVPVNISPVIEENETDKVNKVQQLLSSNGIEYKKYNNENGHIFIIEV